MTGFSGRRRDILVCLCLGLVTAAVYWPVRHFAFVNYDDPVYIYQNRHLQAGLTANALGWALTTGLDQWMPVTWMVRILEWRFFGPDAGGHHVVNVVFHIANTLLLFTVLRRMTGAVWRSAFVAGLFALHPLHVEPVAWVTGFKDVLSTCFWMLTVWAYAKYVQQRNIERRTPTASQPPVAAFRLPPSAFYSLSLFLFALGLMSKPMVVTLPFVLLLLDYWPLGRTRWAKPALIQVSGQSFTEVLRESPSQLLKEKIPFLVLTAVSCVLTFQARHGAGTLASLRTVPLGDRVANALISYVIYLRQLIWPGGLTVFYPYRRWPWDMAVEAGALLVLLTVVVFWRARREPSLVVGWLWYLGTLVPVLGLIQVGSLSMADRYTYLPLIGLFIMVAWSVPGDVLERRAWKLTAWVVPAMVLAVCAVLSQVQLGYWRNSETLFRHAVSVTPNNWLAHDDLGVALQSEGRITEAIVEYRESLRINPNNVRAHNNLALALFKEGKVQEAIGHWKWALQLAPAFAEAHNNLGNALLLQDNLTEAIEQFEQAVRFKPDFAEAHNNLGTLLLEQGKVAEAIAQFDLALRFHPDYAQAHNNLGIALEKANRLTEAISHYQEALRLNPDLAEARQALVRLQAAR